MKKLIQYMAAICCTLSPIFSNAQIGTITTVTGTGIAGYSGDGGAATAARIDHPIAIAIDTFGNVFFADMNNHRVRRISATGVITTVAGTGVPGYSGDGGAATAAQLQQPYGVALDNSGNLFIADMSNHRVRRVSTTGTITTYAGNGTGAFGGDGGPASTAQIWNPTNVRFDNTGNLYIADNQNQRIRKVTSAGVISTVAGNGAASYSGDGGPATAASLNYPGSIWIDATGNVFISDHINNVIRKVNPSGIISTIAGNGTLGYSGDGGAATTAMLQKPTEVIADNSGNIYISDLNHRLRKVNTSGTITTIAGTGVASYSGDGGPATAAAIYGPAGMFFSRTGYLYFSDANNNAIRRIGIATTSVNTYPTTSFAFFPNPAHNSLFITSSDEIHKVVISDLAGHIVFQADYYLSHVQVDVSSLAEGMYLLGINGQNAGSFIRN